MRNLSGEAQRSKQREIIRSGRFVEDAAQFILKRARAALSERNEFRIALSGGNTPRPIYETLAAQRELPWERVLVTFGDERCVPPEDAQSNFRMACETLLEPADVPDASVVRMRGELDPQLAADEYEQKLDQLAAQRVEAIYRHDLVLLGVGDDGHTASLFPETAALEEEARRVVANYVPKLSAWRLTFTFPLLAAAREVCFLVNAAKQAELIEKLVAGDRSFPAGRVAATAARVTWIIGH